LHPLNTVLEIYIAASHLPQVRVMVEAIKRKGLKESINSAPVRTIEKYRSKSETRVLNKILTAKHRDKI